jgi:hypothetical protein
MTPLRLRSTLALALTTLVSQACSDEAPPSLPTLEKGWNVIKPGGETTCSRGDPFMFFVHPGTVNRLVIDFMGGGACWNDGTCGYSDALFIDRIDEEHLRYEGTEGIYDRENPENPFKDWYHVFVPYCTGDVHWGNNVKTYGTGDKAFTINHKGGVNARAVLDWVYDNFGGPETVFMTGCSAGSYGSIGAAPHVMEHYKDSRVVQMGDSGAGIITDMFFRDSFPNWKAETNFPSWIPALDPGKIDIFMTDLAYLYKNVGLYYPGRVLSQFNTSFDSTQGDYFKAMGGGSVDEWSSGMTSSIDEIHQGIPNFYSYTAGGRAHCVIPYESFYTVKTNGVRLRDWVDMLANGGKVDNVKCEDCTTP